MIAWLLWKSELGRSIFTVLINDPESGRNLFTILTEFTYEAEGTNKKLKQKYAQTRI